LHAFLLTVAWFQLCDRMMAMWSSIKTKQQSSGQITRVIHQAEVRRSD
jgi:hypothetical protein